MVTMPVATSATPSASGKAGAPVPTPGFPDWQKVFPPSRVAAPPALDPDFCHGSPGLLRALFVDLADVALSLYKRRDRYAALEIHADVIRIGAPVHFALESLTLHARRIEVSPGAALILAQPGDDRPCKPGMRITAQEIAFEKDAVHLRTDFLGIVSLLTKDDMPGCTCFDHDPARRTLQSLPEDDRKPVKAPERARLHAALLSAKILEIDETIASVEQFFLRLKIQDQKQKIPQKHHRAEHEARRKALDDERANLVKLLALGATGDETPFKSWNDLFGRYEKMLQTRKALLDSFRKGERPPTADAPELSTEDRELLRRMRSIQPQMPDVDVVVDAILEDYEQLLRVVRALESLGNEIRSGVDRGISRTHTARCAPGDPLLAEFELQTARCLQYMTGADSSRQYDQAVRMAQWVNDCHSHPDGDARLASESSLLLGHLLGKNRRLHYVPPLQFSQYFDLAHATAEALQAVEQKAACFFDRDADNSYRQKAAEAMLMHYETSQGLTGHLLIQARTATRAAKKASETSAARLEEQYKGIDEIKKTFDAGVQEKEQELRNEKIWAVIGGLVILGVAIAEACMGNPAAAAGAGDAVKKAAAAGESLEGLSKLAESLAKCMASVKKLLAKLGEVETLFKVLNGAYQGYRAYEDFATTAKITQQAADPKFAADAAPSDIMTAAQWDEFTLEMRHAFKGPIDIGIRGAADYLLALEKLSVRAKDVLDTQLHLAHCKELQAQRRWERHRDKVDIKIAKVQVNALNQDTSPDFAMLLLCDRLSNQLKFQLLAALADAGDAYRYYTMSEPTFRASIRDDGAALQALVAQAKGDEVAAKASFSSPAGDWGPQYHSVTDPADLARLKARRKMDCCISAEEFRGFERLRVKEVRVWLTPSPPIGQQVYFKITTSGVYQDRWKGQKVEYCAKPFLGTFAYNAVQTGKTEDPQGKPVHVYACANDSTGEYFQPTPFAVWELSLPEENNPGLDLDAITQVDLAFSGTFISTAS